MQSFLVIAASFATAFLACSTPAEPGAAPQPDAPAPDASGARRPTRVASNKGSASPAGVGAVRHEGLARRLRAAASDRALHAVDVPFDHAHPEDGRALKLALHVNAARAFPSGGGGMAKAVFQLAGGPAAPRWPAGAERSLVHAEAPQSLRPRSSSTSAGPTATSTAARATRRRRTSRMAHAASAKATISPAT